MLALALKPGQIIVLSLASHLNREQQRVVAYLQAENQVPLTPSTVEIQVLF